MRIKSDEELLESYKNGEQLGKISEINRLLLLLKDKQSILDLIEVCHQKRGEGWQRNRDYLP